MEDGARTGKSACLEGWVSQDRRSPGTSWHVKPKEQLQTNFVRR
jgi:hypothetical protein